MTDSHLERDMCRAYAAGSLVGVAKCLRETDVWTPEFLRLVAEQIMEFAANYKQAVEALGQTVPDDFEVIQ